MSDPTSTETGGLIRDRETKAELRAALIDLTGLARDVGLASLANDLESTRIPKLDREQFHLVVLGEFNHGKSTFVNALLGADVLPAGITPTTAAINHVIYAPSPTARVVLTSGESKLLDPGALKEWVTVAGGHAGEASYVELGYPSELLTNNVVLVDTPGVNDLKVISFEGAFHGRTLLTMAMTGKVVPYKTKFGPFPGGVWHVPFPVPHKGVTVEDTIHAIEWLFKADVEPSRVAAIIIEPVQGEGGIRATTTQFLKDLRAICDEFGLLLFYDEIHTGFGRTGKMWGHETMGFTPDLMPMAKGPYWPMVAS